MISEEVQRRVASYYMGSKMTEEKLSALEGALIDTIWFSNECISEEELVKIGIKLINSFLEEDTK